LWKRKPEAAIANHQQILLLHDKRARLNEERRSIISEWSDPESETEDMVLDMQMQENQPEARAAHNSELELQKKKEELKAALGRAHLPAVDKQHKLIERQAVELQKKQEELKVELEREQLGADVEEQRKLIEGQAMELQKKEEKLKAALEIAEQKACAHSVELRAAEHNETINQPERKLKKCKPEAAIANHQQILLLHDKWARLNQERRSIISELERCAQASESTARQLH
jgi:hypothetical protein